MQCLALWTSYRQAIHFNLIFYIYNYNLVSHINGSAQDEEGRKILKWTLKNNDGSKWVLVNMVRSLKFTSNAQTFLTRLMIQQLLKKGLGPLSYLYIHLVQSHHFTVTKYLFTDYLVCGISMCLSLKYNFCIFKNTGTCKLGFYPLPWLNKVTAI